MSPKHITRDRLFEVVLGAGGACFTLDVSAPNRRRAGAVAIEMFPAEFGHLTTATPRVVSAEEVQLVQESARQRFLANALTRLIAIDLDLDTASILETDAADEIRSLLSDAERLITKRGERCSMAAPANSNCREILDHAMRTFTRLIDQETRYQKSLCA